MERIKRKNFLSPDKSIHIQQFQMHDQIVDTRQCSWQAHMSNVHALQISMPHQYAFGHAFLLCQEWLKWCTLLRAIIELNSIFKMQWHSQYFEIHSGQPRVIRHPS